ncbi:MAG: DNA translocase FtsK [SAR202 cluster bacterium]|nr:DNA translocase FtsK [SAR202 cluster bacterium]
MLGSLNSTVSNVNKIVAVFNIRKIAIGLLLICLIVAGILFIKPVQNLFLETLGLLWLYVGLWVMSLGMGFKISPRITWKFRKVWLFTLIFFAGIYTLASLWQSTYHSNQSYITFFGGWIVELGTVDPLLRLALLCGVLLILPMVVSWNRTFRLYYVACITATRIGLDLVKLLMGLLIKFSRYAIKIGIIVLGKIKAISVQPKRRKSEISQPNLEASVSLSSTPSVLPKQQNRMSTLPSGSVPVLTKRKTRKLIKQSVSNPSTAIVSKSVTPNKKNGWIAPDDSLLAPPERKATTMAPLEKMKDIIEQTLLDHGVQVQVNDIKAGPRIVRFGLVPGWSLKSPGMDPKEKNRVKVQSIVSREKDLALALQTPYIRIEAPVPGEPIIGLEVPNPSPAKVPLSLVTNSDQFVKMTQSGGLPIALGQDTGGEPVSLDLATLPHLLIAGSTGSGKSVCINSLIASLLLTQGPDKLRMLMIDPKRVELTPFNGLPHLVKPVIVDTDEVSGGLKGLMREMFRRYRMMEDAGSRNIVAYNKKAKNDEQLPYLVLVVDELADLMMSASGDVEHNLVRLAQLGRATGIHLVLATQRPSVQVVTGLLKANIPGRVAFAVASNVDSRVILDTVGAEKLLGQGDMLLLSNSSPKPKRVQGTLVKDSEISAMVKYWVNQNGPELLPLPMDFSDDDDDEMIDDKILDESRKLAIRYPNMSRSHLERQLRIGATKAGRIINILEEEGLVNMSF